MNFFSTCTGTCISSLNMRITALYNMQPMSSDAQLAAQPYKQDDL